MEVESGNHDNAVSPRRLQVGATATIVLAWAAALIAIVTAAIVSWIGFYDTPYGDHWILVPDLGRLDNLLAPHSEHPILFGRVAFWIDWEIFEGRGRFLQLLTLALLAAQVPAFVWLARRTGISRPLLIVIPVALTLILSSREHQNFIWAFQASFVPTFTLGLWSFCLFAGYLQQNSRFLLAASVATAVLAGLSLANGGFAPLVLAGMAIVFGRRWIALAFALIAIACLSLSFIATSEAETTNILSVPAIVRFILVYLGAPAAGWGEGAALAAGGATLLAAIAAFVYVIRRRRSDAAFVALAGVLAFTLMTVGVTALGRSFGSEIFGVVGVAAGSRYHVVLALIYLAVWIIATDALRQNAGPIRRLLLLSPVAAGLLVASALAGIPVIGTLSETHRRDTAGVTAMVAGVEDRAVIELAGFFIVIGRGDIVAPGVERLRTEQKSVFADPVARRVGQSLTTAELALPACGAALWAMSSPPDAGDGHRLANGEFARTQASAGASHVLIADATGTIVGYGRVPRRPSDLNPFAGADGKNVDWQGHVRPSVQPPLTAWLSTADTVRCSLGPAAPPA